MAYTDTFILVSDDCPTATAMDPSRGRDTRSRAEIEYDLLRTQPYHFDHRSLTHRVHVDHKMQFGDTPLGFDDFHAKGQPCLRASALVKRYGWGAHHDAQGRIALYPVDGPDYARLIASPDIKTLKGMRNRRA